MRFAFTVFHIVLFHVLIIFLLFRARCSIDRHVLKSGKPSFYVVHPLVYEVRQKYEMNATVKLMKPVGLGFPHTSLALKLVTYPLGPLFIITSLHVEGDGCVSILEFALIPSFILGILGTSIIQPLLRKSDRVALRANMQ